MSVQEIESAIVQLSRDELSHLMRWFEDYYAQVWDQQIEDDLELGRLDVLLAEVDAEYELGLTQPL